MNQGSQPPDKKKSQQTARPKPVTRSARNKMMDLLALRDHSEKELRKKLKQKDFSEQEINKALDEAKDHNWLADPTELADRFARSLHQKNKGLLFINHQLSQKGLPTLEMDPQLELEKALRIVENKYSSAKNLSREEMAKVTRFLTSRGFDSNTIRRVIKKDHT